MTGKISNKYFHILANIPARKIKRAELIAANLVKKHERNIPHQVQAKVIRKMSTTELRHYFSSAMPKAMKIYTEQGKNGLNKAIISLMIDLKESQPMKTLTRILPTWKKILKLEKDLPLKEDPTKTKMGRTIIGHMKTRLRANRA